MTRNFLLNCFLFFVLCNLFFYIYFHVIITTVPLLDSGFCMDRRHPGKIEVRLLRAICLPANRDVLMTVI